MDLQECTDKCKSIQHGDLITAAISRRSVSDYDLCCYLNAICCCCESVKDSVGRTALHVASSLGRIDLVKWLVENRHANINIKDDESGFTALHRSIFYGRINVAIELLKLGANPTIFDFNSLTMLDHIMLDGYNNNNNNLLYNKGGELYVWGANSNNALGTQTPRSIPELFDSFHKKHPMDLVQKHGIDKFHSLILTLSGKVFTCGHGQGGRLGLGHQQTVVIPEAIKFPLVNHETTICFDFAISRDHNLFLCTTNTVYSCGVNTHKVLGLNPPPNQILQPTQIRKFPQILFGVAAGRYHSVAWGKEFIYTWGLNAGQLGHKLTGENYILLPKRVQLPTLVEIVMLASSDGAITFYTNKGDIYILHEFQCRKIASRQLNLIQIEIFGGKINSSMIVKDVQNEASKELKVICLTNTGNVLVWQESDQQLCRCIYSSLARPIIVKQLTFSTNATILFVTIHGEAFEGFLKARKKKTLSEKNTAFHKFLDREDCVSVKLKKFPRIHRGIFITGNGHDFCVIQKPPYKDFPQSFADDLHSISKMEENLQQFLEETHENDDLHDVILKVDHRYFPVHKFILSSHSTYFEKLFTDTSHRTTIKIDDCNPLIFEQFLQFIYSGNCQLFRHSTPEKFAILFEEKMKGTLKDVDGKTRKHLLRMLEEICKKFKCFKLYTRITGKFAIDENLDDVREMMKFQRNLPQFHDVLIKCSDQKTISAHKCILAARSHYFNNQFSTRWGGNYTEIISLSSSKNVVDSLLNYLYSDDLSHLNHQEQDHLFKLIVLGDQLFIEELKEKCEHLLLSNMNLKNCVQYLCFSHIYNAENLKMSCLKFISANLAPIVELRLLDDVDDQVLKQLSDFYCEETTQICRRVITPYSTAPCEEEILSITSAFPISLDEQVEKSAKKRRSRHKSIQTPSPNKLEVEQHEEMIVFEEGSLSEIYDKEEKILSKRMKAIQLAQSDREDLGDSDFTILNCNNFPILNSPPSSINKNSKTFDKFNTKSKIVKVSQKQRKRLSSENTEIVVEECEKNPWKITNFTNLNQVANLNEIVSDEKKQKENLVKIKSKLLIYTQMEDKAIEDICKFYNCDGIDDELIIVERVHLGAVAPPVWIPKKKLESIAL